MCVAQNEATAVTPERTRREDLDAWVRAAAPRAVAYARSLLRDTHTAEDVVQDCFGRLLAKADVYDLPGDGTKLLFKAVTNACINARTRRRKIFRLLWGHDEHRVDDPPDERTEPPDGAMVHAELSAAVASGLALLPVPQRAALELKSLGHSQQEIAEALGVSPTNAGVLVHRARKALTESLAPFLDSESVS
jgi:RNA polymerase sigma-70 factor (ECF subfamily)